MTANNAQQQGLSNLYTCPPKKLPKRHGSINDIDEGFVAADFSVRTVLRSAGVENTDLVCQLFDSSAQRHVRLSVQDKWREWLRFLLTRTEPSYILILQNCKTVRSDANNVSMTHSPWQIVLDGTEDSTNAEVFVCYDRSETLEYAGHPCFTWEWMMAQPTVKRIQFRVPQAPQFTLIHDINVNNKAKLNTIIGTVMEFTLWSSTKGEDLKLVLTLADPSCTTHEEIGINVFARSEAELPIIRKIGDIARFTSVQFKVWNNKAQGTVNLTTKWKKRSTCLLYSGAPGTSLEPYFLSANARQENPPPVSADIINGMRRWYAERALEFPNPEFAIEIGATIPTKTSFDMTARMMGINGDKNIILLWDGTGSPDDSRKLRRPPLPPSAFALGTRLSDPETGFVQPVVVQRDAIPLLQHVAVGDWIHLRNLRNDNGMVLVHRDTRCRVLPNEAKVVAALMTRYEQRVIDEDAAAVRAADEAEEAKANRNNNNNNNADTLPLPDVAAAVPPPPPPPQPQPQRLPPATVVTRVNVPETPFTPLRAIRMDKTPAPRSYRALVRVVKFWPSKLRDFVSLVCDGCGKVSRCTDDPGIDRICSLCGLSANTHFEYLFKLSLVDSSGTLEVNLARKEAKDFFPGLPPVNLYTNNETLKSLYERMKLLMAITSCMDCWIEAYIPEHNHAEIEYRISRTNVVSPPG